MYTSLQSAALPPLPVNLDTANLEQLAYSLVRATGQPQLLIDCRALPRLRTMGVCDVISRLLLLRRTGAHIVLLHAQPWLRRSLQLLRLEYLFTLAE